MTSVYRKDKTMTDTYSVSTAANAQFDDLTDYVLSSPSQVSVTFVPGAGMVGTSLLHRGAELLGMRAGLGPYRESGKTFGIPLLAPWANRLVANEFAGRTLVTDGTPGVHLDGNGLPIHGLLAGCADWSVTRAEAVPDGESAGAWLKATLAFDDARADFPAFPFPHELSVEVHLRETTVTVTTSVTATGDVVVPIAFGWHPYFAPPGGDRQDWTLAKPFTHHVELDDRCVPTGEVTRVPVEVDVLGDPQRDGVVFDDLFCEVPAGTKAWVEGGQRRITLSYDSGYDYAVLYAPADQPLVAIEPMTAPTDPLSGHFPIKSVAPGETYTATFGIHVTESGVPA